MRFYISLLKLYIEENNYFSKTLKSFWTKEIKNYIMKKYPMAIKGHFNENSDLLDKKKKLK